MSSVFLTKSGEDSYQLETNVLKGFIATFSTSIDADIFITDLEGNILLGNYANSKLTTPRPSPSRRWRPPPKAAMRAGAPLAACTKVPLIS